MCEAVELVETGRFAVWAVRLSRERWFGRSVARFTLGTSTVDYASPAVRALIEPHVRKMRRARDALFVGAPPWTTGDEEDGKSCASVLAFDADAYPLDAAFRWCLGLPDHVALTDLHAFGNGDGGEAWKRRVLAPLADAGRRDPLERLYEAWLLDVVLPRFFDAVPVVKFQRFPCVRVQLPGELTIGPHCDTMYGHAPATVNVSVLLSDARGTASLVYETAPGREDWVAFEGGRGSALCFAGAASAHFTSENTTGRTRVSLDARLVPVHEDEAAATASSVSSFDSLPSSYFGRAARDARGAWRVVDRPTGRQIDPRVGLPFDAAARDAATTTTTTTTTRGGNKENATTIGGKMKPAGNGVQKLLFDREEEVPPRRRKTKPKVPRVVGPEPVLLGRFEVDALYDTLEVVAAALSAEGVEFILIAGSLLGATRSRSILFCDDDVDIAVIAGGASSGGGCSCCYEGAVRRARAVLAEGAAVGRVAQFAQRPWPACDRLRPRAAPAAWIDVFYLRRFEAEAELRRFVGTKVNGHPQPRAFVDACCAAAATASSYPLWHYDAPKAISLWPREYLSEAELYPIRHDLTLGPLAGLPGPRCVVGPLARFFGDDAFDKFVVHANHGRSTTTFPTGVLLPLAEAHYEPVQHSRRHRRVPADGWSRAHLHAHLRREALLEFHAFHGAANRRALLAPFLPEDEADRGTLIDAQPHAAAREEEPPHPPSDGEHVS